MAQKNEQDKEDLFKENLKKGFDKQILKEYVTDFTKSQKRADGTLVPPHMIWDDLAKQLCSSYHAARRYALGVDKHGEKPVSPLDGLIERYEPGFEEVFRYIAARDLIVEFSRGRVIINRATARALIGIRKAHTGQLYRLHPHEVERLRLPPPVEAQNIPRPRFSIQTVQAMRSPELCDLVGPIDSSDHSVEELNRLFDEWNAFYDDFVYAVEYPWVV